MTLKYTPLAILLFILMPSLMSSSFSFAQTIRPFDVGATINARAKLTINSTTITFPDANPDSVPNIAALENPVSVTSSARSNFTVDLTVLVSGDLTSGSDTIPITNITWTRTGTGYRIGTMNRTTPQLAGRWTGSGNRNGTFSYFLVNSWSYAKGSYTATAIYTLTAP